MVGFFFLAQAINSNGLGRAMIHKNILEARDDFILFGNGWVGVSDRGCPVVREKLILTIVFQLKKLLLNDVKILQDFMKNISL